MAGVVSALGGAHHLVASVVLESILRDCQGASVLSHVDSLHGGALEDVDDLPCVHEFICWYSILRAGEGV